MLKSLNMAEKRLSLLSPVVRVLISFIAPILIAIAFALLVSQISGRAFVLERNDPRQNALLLGGIGLASWYIGWRLYGLKNLGLRFGRPLFASTGFASLAWIIFLVLRLVLVEPGPGSLQQVGIGFLFLLVFEAFCTQLWSFGLFFRSVADWRGALAAAVSSGILFGLVGYLLFQESFTAIPASALYFVVWGVLYGVIRLRTGSLLGAVFIQGLQSWSSWQLLKSGLADPNQLQILYLVASAIYLIIIWRLWPKEESDYRV
jgi:hypothetical protein